MNIIIFLPISFQYSLYSKKENAHDEAGWCCAWKNYEPSDEAMDTSENTENGGGENKENEEDPSKKSPPEPREVVITGKISYQGVNCSDEA